jgi:CheY-like chemotaxis protein
MSQCPACTRANPDDARFCNACGTPLVRRCPVCDVINVRSRVRCHHCAAMLDPQALPPLLPDEPDGPDVGVVPVLDTPDDTEPAGWTLSLRDGPTLSASGSGASLPDIDPTALLPADRDAPQHVLPAAPSPAAAMADPDALAARKARRRAAVRQAQQTRPAGTDAAPAICDVLVLEADPRARADLCRTLELFGFRPHVAVSAAEAVGLSLRQLHVAAFLGLGSDYESSDTESLCRRLHDARRGRPLALIAIGDRKRHADRIRMQLAGADQVLFRPVGRGDVARALADCGLRLPRDPRDHAPG